MLLEICIDCIESALAAESGGADRIEICGGLAVGGLTPSVGLIHQCLERCEKVRTMIMIRPHDGGFCYSDDDIGTMLRDIDVAKELGVNGVVLGTLTADGQIDIEKAKRLVETARPLEVTFHRAFDVARDPMEALDALLALQVDRLLTSGRAKSAVAGAELIGRLARHAGESLTVIAAAGIGADNAAQLVRVTGVKEIHASASVARSISEHDDDGVSFGDLSRVTSVDSVRALVAALGANQ
jgi:copper homeostasis protein